jgi:dienelactone hydrolase
MEKNQNSSFTRRSFLQAAPLGAVFGSPKVLNAQNENDVVISKKEMMQNLIDCLGGPWPEPCLLKPNHRETIKKEGYRIESVTYEVEPGDRVPALIMIPDEANENNPSPAIAVWHQHGGQYHLGKTEPAGLAGSDMHHTGVNLVKEGYVVICPDALCFEERQDSKNKLKGGSFERYEFLRYVVEGKSMAWKNILDMRRAIDYLVNRPEVKEEKIGCYGHSMGSTHTWLVGPHEPRIKALVGNCCLPTYSAIHDARLLHCFPNFVPGWLEYGDTPEIVSLIAPRALHLNLGEKDAGSPIKHAEEGIKRITKAYQKLNAEDQFSAFIQKDTGHVLSPEMWHKTKTFFEKHLKS